MIAERSTIMDNNIRVRMLGRRDEIPAQVLAELDKTVAMSQANTRHVAQSGDQLRRPGGTGRRDAEASPGKSRPASSPRQDIREATIAAELYTAGAPDPDLLIRTAGEMRISNFLLWQISYAEIWVTEKCWPEFDEATLHEAIRDVRRPASGASAG